MYGYVALARTTRGVRTVWHAYSDAELRKAIQVRRHLGYDRWVAAEKALGTEG